MWLTNALCPYLRLSGGHEQLPEAGVPLRERATLNAPKGIPKSSFCQCVGGFAAGAWSAAEWQLPAGKHLSLGARNCCRCYDGKCASLFDCWLVRNRLFGPQLPAGWMPGWWAGHDGG